MSIIKKNALILFQGDSITDAGRDRDNLNDLGPGYPDKVNRYLSAFCADRSLRVLNRGVSGDRVRNLQQRWQADCMDLKPDVVSILIGINDCWRRYDENDPTSVEDFEAGYREILTKTAATGAQILLIEPYVFAYPQDRIRWREDLDPKIHAVRRLAHEFHTLYIPLDGIFATLSIGKPEGYFSEDGVHPTDAGHAIIANEWLKAVGIL